MIDNRKREPKVILKKPYAFLIKYFRIIHLLLLVPIGYLISKTYRISSFFRGYVSNNYSTNIINLAAEHINFFMYLAVIAIIVSALAIYYLMRQKRKSTKLYFFLIIYYMSLFVLIGVTHSILSNMEHNLITAQTARAYRDLSFVLCLPEYFFFLYTLIRGIGFDIKKFDFANDLKDLEISDIDNEEFEFSINVEGYKAKRTLRRFLRETKYYILENTFIFMCILVIFLIFIGTTIYLNYGVYNKTYHTSDKMTHNYFNIQITDSILTNLGLDGNVITEGKYYLMLQLLIENRTNRNEELDYNNFRLVHNGKNIYPTLDRGEYFIDYGKAYNKEKIKSKTKNYYTLVYEIDETELANEYTIKILEGIDYKVGEIAAKYKNIQLNPKKITDIIEEQSLSKDKIANLKNSSLGLTTFKVNSYYFSNSYTYSYSSCNTQNKCTTLKDKITTNISSTIEKTTLLILDMEYSLDQNSVYAGVIRSDNQFFNQFFSIRYQKNNTTKIISLSNKTTKNMQNTLVFETRQEVLDADKIELLLTVRNHRYVFQLK